MRVVVTGATGNLGTSLVGALGEEPWVDEIVGIARREPTIDLPKLTWAQADVSKDSLDALFEKADVVVHCAWAIQPSHQEHRLAATNVTGTRRVFQAAVECGAKTLVHMSSVGAYSPGPKDRQVDESWPTRGISSSSYSRHKALAERMLDDIEREHPDMNVVRMRPGLIFKGDSAAEIHRFFLGALVPTRLLSKRPIPIVPNMKSLTFQAVHASDVARAICLAIEAEARGAFNLAADPVLTADQLADVAHAFKVPMSPPVLRAVVNATWNARLQPTSPGWIDMATMSPLLDAGRAKNELGWTPSVEATQALRELLDGLASGRGFPTPPLHAAENKGHLQNLGAQLHIDEIGGHLHDWRAAVTKRVNRHR